MVTSSKKSLPLMLIGLLTLLFLTECRQNRTEKIQSDLNRACELMQAGEDEDALEILLKAESQIDETVTPEVKINLYTTLAIPYYNSYVHRFGTSKIYTEKAIEVARDADSLRWLPGLLWNMVVNTQHVDSLLSLLRECRDLSDRFGNKEMSGRARVHLAQVYLESGKLDLAEVILDSLINKDNDKSGINIELALERSLLYKLKGDLSESAAILRSIGSDKLSLDGKETKYRMLYEMSREQGFLNEALMYRDSLVICQDSIKKIIQTEKLSKAESNYTQNIIREEGKRRLLWSVSVGVVLLLIILIFFLNKSRKMKVQQVKLIENISKLNLSLSELSNHEEIDGEKDVKTDSTSDKIETLIEKFRLTKEFYFTLPQSSLVEQLNLVPNSEDIPKDKLKTATDSIIGNFAESCSNLRQMFESLTTDDTLLCVLVYVGLHKGVVEVLMKVSEDALRKRKSRIKQKLPLPLFELFFSK